MTARAALVVPEFRTEYSQGGGLATVAEFLKGVLENELGMHVQYYSVRMSARAPQSRRLLAPSTWRRGPINEVQHGDGESVVQCGVPLAELELTRYQPTRALRRELSDKDLVVAVGGSPMILDLLKGLDVPTVGQVATLVSAERAAEIARLNPLRALFAKSHVAVVSAVERHACKVPNLVLVENPMMLEFVRSHGARKVLNVPPGVDTDFFRPVERAEENRGYILSVGRLSDPRKSFDRVVRAYATARHDGLTQQLVLAGLYDLPAHVYALIDQLGLRAHVRVARNLGREELRELYQHADGFVLASAEEGLGLAILEAMACAVPVLASTTVGAQQILSARFESRLVRLSDDFEEDLAAGMVSMAQMSRQEWESLGQALRAEVLDQYSVQSAGKSMALAIREILPGGSA